MSDVWFLMSDVQLFITLTILTKTAAPMIGKKAFLFLKKNIFYSKTRAIGRCFFSFYSVTSMSSTRAASSLLPCCSVEMTGQRLDGWQFSHQHVPTLKKNQRLERSLSVWYQYSDNSGHLMRPIPSIFIFRWLGFNFFQIFWSSSLWTCGIRLIIYRQETKCYLVYTASMSYIDGRQ